MNKILYAAVLCVALGIWGGAGWAADVAARTDCAAVAAEIATLAAKTDRSADESARLSELQTLSRRDCSKSLGGRRTNARGGTLAPAGNSAGAAAAGAAAVAAANASVAAAVPSAQDVMDKFLAAKQENCAMLKSEISKAADGDGRTKMQGLYDKNCAGAATGAGTAGAGVTATTTVTSAPESSAGAAPEKTPEEIEALIKSGLCADGTKPNKFGCCANETFKDLGNTVFACCPNDGGECYPPIQ